MKGSLVPIWLTFTVVLVASYGFFKAWQHTREEPFVASVPVLDLPPIEEFTLQERSGREFNSKEMDGQVWVASFFFSTCPSACAQLNRGLQELQTDESLRDVRFVSITCDPDTDTPAVLREYALRYSADPERWLFCTGDLEYVKRIGRDMMKVGIERQTHANFGIVIDRGGKIRGHYTVTEPVQRQSMVKMLRECLAEPAPEKPEAVEVEAVAAVEAGPTGEGAPAGQTPDSESNAKVESP